MVQLKLQSFSRQFRIQSPIISFIIETFNTARIRRMGEGNIFTLCVSPHLNQGEVFYPAEGEGGTLIPGQDWGVPPQDWLGVPLHWDWMGYPHWDWMGVPLSRLDGGSLPPLGMYGNTLPPRRDWMGYPHWDHFSLWSFKFPVCASPCFQHALHCAIY